MYTLWFLLAACATATWQNYLSYESLTFKKVTRAYLIAIVFFNIGCVGVFRFFGHAFMPDEWASSVGWPPGNPFQFEVAVANLAFGLLGLLSPLCRPSFWSATVTGNFIFLLGAGWGHFIQWLQGDSSPYNTGPAVWIENFFIPLLTLALMGIYYFVSMHHSKEE